nr:programmed cell death protein 6 [Quercus suber]POF20076.1 programmed cell death protein 6 [Quercus suber]
MEQSFMVLYRAIEIEQDTRESAQTIAMCDVRGFYVLSLQSRFSMSESPCGVLASLLDCYTYISAVAAPPPHAPRNLMWTRGVITTASRSRRSSVDSTFICPLPPALPVTVRLSQVRHPVCFAVSALTLCVDRHAEPEQAAQILSQSSGGPPPRNSYENKPVPPPPQPMQNTRPQQDDRYGGRPGPGQYQSPGGYGSSGGPPPAQQGSQGYYDQAPGRSSSQRHDRYDPNPQSPRYGQGQGGQSQQAPPPPPRNNYASPPPPQSYGQGPPPQGYHNRPPIPDSQRPPTAAPPPPRDGNDREALWPLFLQVDTDRSGELDETELRRALVNGDYTASSAACGASWLHGEDFLIVSVSLGIRRLPIVITYTDSAPDVDRSGNISLREFQDALVAFGYRLGPQFTQLLFGTYARSHSRGRGDNNEREKVLSFDLFVQACISLKRSTDVFRRVRCFGPASSRIVLTERSSSSTRTETATSP